VRFALGCGDRTDAAGRRWIRGAAWRSPRRSAGAARAGAQVRVGAQRGALLIMEGRVAAPGYRVSSHTSAPMPSPPLRPRDSDAPVVRDGLRTLAEGAKVEWKSGEAPTPPPGQTPALSLPCQSRCRSAAAGATVGATSRTTWRGPRGDDQGLSLLSAPASWRASRPSRPRRAIDTRGHQRRDSRRPAKPAGRVNRCLRERLIEPNLDPRPPRPAPT
jgi:hypothetical protein